LFDDEAIQLIYQYTQGYPRKILLLCHDAIEEVVMQEKETIDADIINKLIMVRQEYD
jgi:type II secretory pathway predicted ATPase ExeA